MVGTMERQVILNYLKGHPGLSRQQIVERLSDPATEHVTQEALALLVGEGAVFMKMDGTYHAR